MTVLDDKFAEWTIDQKLTFLETLSHGLTVGIRCIWSDEELSAEDMVERIKWINELHHRVPLRARSLRLGHDDWAGENIGLDFQHWATICPAVAGIFGQAIKDGIKVAGKQGQSQ